MFQLSITPRITVTIGGVTRLYLAFVTTAPSDLDLPRTLTVDEGPFEDVIAFAADSFLADAARIHATARVVLVEASDHAWQRATYRGHYHLFVAADRLLVSPEKLQSLLWQRLERRVVTAVAA